MPDEAGTREPGAGEETEQDDYSGPMLVIDRYIRTVPIIERTMP